MFKYIFIYNNLFIYIYIIYIFIIKIQMYNRTQQLDVAKYSEHSCVFGVPPFDRVVLLSSLNGSVTAQRRREQECNRSEGERGASG